MPLTEWWPDGRAIEATIISLRVSVPVLSVQITETAPSVSIDGSFRTMTCRCAILRTPMASVIVSTAGRPSGIAATVRPTTAMNISSNGMWPTKYPKVNSTTARIRIIAVSHCAKRFICSTSGVVNILTSCNMPLIWPISVSRPVAVTTPRPDPATAIVPLKAIDFRSPNGASAETDKMSFSTGTDSPVRIDS